MQRYFEMIRHGDDLQKVYYFTAPVKGSSRADQKDYILALTTQALIRVVEGRFKTKKIRCRVTGCQHPGHRFFQAPEEKETDVNIALQMLDDAYQDLCDRFILVSGDSDLVPAVGLIKERFPKKQVFVYVPSRNPKRGQAVQLRSVADHARILPLDRHKLQAAQFPNQVTISHDVTVTKPADW